MSKTPKRQLGAATLPGAAQLLAVIAPLPAPPKDHPHRNFDKAVRGTMVRLSGVSTHAFIEAWSDWAQHMARSPGRQLDFGEHEQQNALKLLALACGPGTPTPPFRQTKRASIYWPFLLFRAGD
jgi:polyhydroxyalkanoate synthase